MSFRLQPQDRVSEAELDRGLRSLLGDGMLSQVMGAFTGGAFLVAYALMLGASNTMIGIIAALGPLTQILQIPAIVLVERWKRRKSIVVLGSLVSRLFLFASALIPFFVAKEWQLHVFMLCLLVYFGLGTISGCAFNSWIRDLIPEGIMGSFFGKRLALATALSAGLSLLAGFMIDYGSKTFTEGVVLYTILFGVGGLCGLFGVFYLAATPEPRMEVVEHEKLSKVLLQPFRHANFLNLLRFLGFWNFAVNLAAPFFTVYMIRRLNISMSHIILLSVLSQVINVLFFRIWGKICDQFSNKSCLMVSGPLFILGIGLWPFLTLPDTHALTMPLLILIHVLSGISTAGVTLASGNIALKIAPKGKATVFLAANAMVSGAAASVAPILAGVLGDWFSKEELTIGIKWFSGAEQRHRFDISALSFEGNDFLFVIAFIIGIYAIHRLLAVVEKGEVSERIVLTQLYNETRHALRSVSNVAGLRHLTYFPYAILLGAFNHGQAGLRRISIKVRIRRKFDSRFES